MQPKSMQSRHQNSRNNGENKVHIPPPSSLPRLKAESEVEQSSPSLTKRKQWQQQQQHQMNPTNNNHVESTQTIMHLKPISLELTAVTAVKIISSRATEQPTPAPAPAPEPPPQPPPTLPLTKLTNVSVSKSSKHFVEQDDIVTNSRRSPPAFISAVSPKMQPLVWGSGGFPARLRPVRVKRHDDTSQDPNGERLKPIEPKLFDFNLGRPESVTDSNEDLEDYNATGGTDDEEGGTLVGQSYHQNQADILNLTDRSDNQTEAAQNNKRVTSPISETVKPTITRMVKSSSNDRLAQYNSYNNHLLRPGKPFPPVTALPVIPPLGHTLLSSSSNGNSPVDLGSWQGLPRLPPLKQYQPALPALPKTEKSKQNNGTNGKSLPSFSMSLVGTKAVTISNSVNNSTDSGSSSQNNEGEKDGSNRMLSLSSGHAGLSSAFRKQLHVREKKTIISP